MATSILITCRQMQQSMSHFADDLDRLEISWTAPRIPGQQFAEGELIELIQGFDALIAGDDEVSRAVLEAGVPRLRTVAKWGVGVDSIDLMAASSLGITVTNTPGMFDDEIADVAFAYVLMLFRGLHRIDRAGQGGDWLKWVGQSTRGKTIGIVGLGGSGLALAARAIAVGMRVVGVDDNEEACRRAQDRGVETVTLRDLLRESDALSLHCPLTPTTVGLIDAEALGQMKPGSILINTSRGRVVVEADLISALQTGHISGAGLDVFEVEPLPRSSPLRGMDSVILGSHNSSNTREAVLRTSTRALENVLAELGIEWHEQ